jgi:hypothetical protein
MWNVLSDLSVFGYPVRVVIGKIICETSQNLKYNPNVTRGFLSHVHTSQRNFPPKPIFARSFAAISTSLGVITYIKDSEIQFEITGFARFHFQFQSVQALNFETQFNPHNKQIFVIKYLLCSPSLVRLSSVFFTITAKTVLPSHNPQTLVRLLDWVGPTD